MYVNSQEDLLSLSLSKLIFLFICMPIWKDRVQVKFYCQNQKTFYKRVDIYKSIHTGILWHLVQILLSFPRSCLASLYTCALKISFGLISSNQYLVQLVSNIFWTLWISIKHLLAVWPNLSPMFCKYIFQPMLCSLSVLFLLSSLDFDQTSSYVANLSSKFGFSIHKFFFNFFKILYLQYITHKAETSLKLLISL